MEQETKKCPYCGEEILAAAKKCKHCGEWLEQDAAPATRQPSLSASYQHEDEDAQERESFFAHHVVKNCSPLFQFTGLLGLKDYWIGSFVLGVVTFSVISSVCILFLAGFLTSVFGKSTLTLMITLCVLPAIVAAGMAVRRLHDTGRSGWLVLLGFVPVANLYLIYLLCQKGQVESGKTTHKPVDYVCWAAAILIPFILGFVAMQSGASLWTDDDEMELVQDIDEALLDDDDDNIEAGDPFQLTLKGQIWDQDAVLVLNFTDADTFSGTCTMVSSAEQYEVNGEVVDSEGTLRFGLYNSEYSLYLDDSDDRVYHCVEHVSTAGGGDIDGGEFRVLSHKSLNAVKE